jgi:hypothetical protein
MRTATSGLGRLSRQKRCDRFKEVIVDEERPFIGSMMPPLPGLE